MSKISFAPLPRYIYGLYAVSAACLLLIVLSFIQAWRCPLTAISGIPGSSETVNVMTGEVRRAPAAPRYADVDLQPGDIVLSAGGLPWQQVQRLNLHELTEARAGERLPITVQRGAHTFVLSLRVVAPNSWEQLMLFRFAISALICWVPATLVLRTLANDLRMQRAAETLSLERSGIPLWCLSWFTLSIGLAISSLRYPIAYLWTDVLLLGTPLLVAAVSLPYPLAPAIRRPRLLLWIFMALYLVQAVGTILNVVQSPYLSDDWRRSVQVLRPQDPIWWTTQILALTGICFGIIGIFATAFSRLIRRGLHRAGARGSGQIGVVLRRLAQRFDQIYTPCPPGVIIIAQFQLMVILLYVCGDMLPRMLVPYGTGSGFSVLLAAIPFSYLLLYGDLRTQIYGRYSSYVLIGIVMLLQLPNLLWRWASGTFGSGTNLVDRITVLIIAFGGLLAGIIFALDQHRRRRTRHDPVQMALDRLFTAQEWAEFWHGLVQDVGVALRIDIWMWLARSSSGEWYVRAHTFGSQAAWLNLPSLQRLLNDAWQPRPSSLLADTIGMPTTLIVLPLWHDAGGAEVVIAANPARVRDGLRLVEDSTLHSRLISAVQSLRSREQQRQQANIQLAQERALVQARERYAEAMRQLERQQRSRTRASNTMLSSLLHENALQRIAQLAQKLRQAQIQGSADTTALLTTTIHECIAIDQEILHVIQNLRPISLGQRIEQAIDQVVLEWEQAYPEITFSYEPVRVCLSLSDEQRDAIMRVIRQAVENAIEHAEASVIRIAAVQQGQLFVVDVIDDGRGFAYDEQRVDSNSLGLLLMHDLTEEIDGKLVICSQPGAGCHVMLRIPITAA